MCKKTGLGRLIPSILTVSILLFMGGLSGCGPGDHGGGDHPGGGDTTGNRGGGSNGGGGIIINEDTVRNHVIPIDLARQYTASFRSSIESFDKSCPGFKDSMQFGHAEAFPGDVFYALLEEQSPKQGKAAGIRIYYGRGSNGEIKMVLIPYDKNGNDIIGQIVALKPTAGTARKEEAKSTSSSDGQAAEDGQRCPTACSTSDSGLN